MHFSPEPSAGRARGITGSALLVLLVSVVPVGADPPPWAVESPAAAEARFGLGLDYLFEHQESLRIDSQRTVIPFRNPDGTFGTMVVDGDPDLLNRKFDLEWELKGPGVQVPLALSSFRLTGLVEVFPTLTLEAATVDVALESISKTESNPKVSLEGRGSLFGAKLGATASLCGSCPWFNGTSYRYRSLPSFDADRSPAFSEPGFEVLHDEVRLSQEVHEVSTRFGYIAPNKRVAYYTGVRGRWTDVEIEDELRAVNELRREMDLSTRTTLGSETVEAIAGVDAYLGGPFFARTETAFSGRDLGVKVTIIRVGTRERSQKDQEATEAKAREIASLLAPRLEQILAAFLEARRSLPVEITATGTQAYPRGAVASLLNDTERDLLLSLTGPEMAAMRDYVQDRFRHARTGLGLQPGSRATLQVSTPVRLASLRPVLMQNTQPGLDKGTADSWLKWIGEAIEKIIDVSENNDLVLTLCVTSSPKNKANLIMHPISYKKLVEKVRTNGRLVNVWRGLYSYTVSRRGFKDIHNELDLVDESGPVLDCELIPDSAPGSAMFCQLKSGNIERECPE